MEKIKVKIIQYGNLPIDYKYIYNFKSSLFEIVSIERKNLWNLQNGFDYCTYTDEEWQKHIKEKDLNADLNLIVTNVFLENNFYARCIFDKTVVFSVAQIFSYLKNAHITLENVILKTLYEYSLILDHLHSCNIWHNETSGCLFDIDGNLEDVAITFARPHICPICKGELLKIGVSKEKLTNSEKELKKLKLSWIYRLFEWIEQHPYCSILITLLTTIACNVLSSFLYDIFVGQNSINAEVENNLAYINEQLEEITSYLENK